MVAYFFNFFQLFQQKMTSIGYFGINDDQTIRIRLFLDENWHLEAVEAAEVAEATEVK